MGEAEQIQCLRIVRLVAGTEAGGWYGRRRSKPNQHGTGPSVSQAMPQTSEMASKKSVNTSLLCNSSSPLLTFFSEYVTLYVHMVFHVWLYKFTLFHKRKIVKSQILGSWGEIYSVKLPHKKKVECKRFQISALLLVKRCSYSTRGLRYIDRYPSIQPDI